MMMVILLITVLLVVVTHTTSQNGEREREEVGVSKIKLGGVSASKAHLNSVTVP